MPTLNRIRKPRFEIKKEGFSEKCGQVKAPPEVYRYSHLIKTNPSST